MFFQAFGVWIYTDKNWVKKHESPHFIRNAKLTWISTSLIEISELEHASFDSIRHSIGGVFRPYWRERTEMNTEPHFVSWEPAGCYQYPKMFRWEPEGLYRCTKSMADSTLLVLYGTSLNCDSILVLNWRFAEARFHHCLKIICPTFAETFQ